MKGSRVFRVDFERDDNGLWFVNCPDLQGAHSHGRSLASSRKNIRQAIAIVLNIDDPAEFDLSEFVHLSNDGLQQAISEATERRRAARASALASTDATRAAIQKALESQSSLSNRDLADLLDLSHQRVQQLASELRS